MSFHDMQHNLVSDDTADMPLPAAFEDPRVVKVFDEGDVFERKVHSVWFKPEDDLPQGKKLLRTLLKDELAPPQANETRMALWLYKHTSPSEKDVWDYVCNMKNNSTVPEHKNERRFMSELMGMAYTTQDMQPYVCFTTDMEDAHTVARIGCLCEYDDPTACALLCLVDVPNDMLELGATADAAQTDAQPKQAPPDTFACCGLLQRPFETKYYRKAAAVVGANYQQPRLFASQTYAGNMRKYGYKLVHTTQVFMKASVAASKMHPLGFYTYRQRDVLDKGGEWLFRS